ncbi:MAG: hypothetical protein A3K09_00925 [Nitrospinae bacterium RIFCSPLOWO2_12_FULL_47_7]|nr:MAG: hypothetical protein A3K09_00925 [Nitrospinae bacterium RIFCSPLOWO2_12_FULL_47_7]
MPEIDESQFTRISGAWQYTSIAQEQRQKGDKAEGKALSTALHCVETLLQCVSTGTRRGPILNPSATVILKGRGTLQCTPALSAKISEKRSEGSWFSFASRQTSCQRTVRGKILRRSASQNDIFLFLLQLTKISIAILGIMIGLLLVINR